MRLAVVADDEQVAGAPRRCRPSWRGSAPRGASLSARLDGRAQQVERPERHAAADRLRRAGGSRTAARPPRRARRATRKGSPAPPTARPPGCRATIARSSAGHRLAAHSLPHRHFRAADKRVKLTRHGIRPYNAGHGFDPRRPLAPRRPRSTTPEPACSTPPTPAGWPCPRRTPRTPTASATCTARCTTARTPVTCAGATAGTRRSRSSPGCTTADYIDEVRASCDDGPLVDAHDADGARLLAGRCWRPPAPRSAPATPCSTATPRWPTRWCARPATTPRAAPPTATASSTTPPWPPQNARRRGIAAGRDPGLGRPPRQRHADAVLRARRRAHRLVAHGARQLGREPSGDGRAGPRPAAAPARASTSTSSCRSAAATTPTCTTFDEIVAPIVVGVRSRHDHRRLRPGREPVRPERRASA